MRISIFAIFFILVSASKSVYPQVTTDENGVRLVYPPLTATCVRIAPDSNPTAPIIIERVPKCHIITEAEAQGNFDTINLPDGWTLKAAFGLPEIHWTAAKVIFGQNTTIVLSQDKQIQKNCSWYGQSNPAPVTRHGKNGPNASNYSGLNGTNLTIDGIESITASSLWVDISGGDGGDGGTGCEGQEGGGWNYSLWQGLGGDGGVGGPGGDGGSTSIVKFKDQNGKLVLTRPSYCSTSCGNVSRPPAASGPNAGIFIYGAPGCGGAPGKGGFPGLGGIMSNGFNDLSKIGRRGSDSEISGHPGSCTQIDMLRHLP